MDGASGLVRALCPTSIPASGFSPHKWSSWALRIYKGHADAEPFCYIRN